MIAVRSSIYRCIIGCFLVEHQQSFGNAKKMSERRFEVDGEKYFKGSDLHKVAVLGDTVGDPFKDTSGPSLSSLFKLIAVISLDIAPLIK